MHVYSDSGQVLKFSRKKKKKSKFIQFLTLKKI